MEDDLHASVLARLDTTAMPEVAADAAAAEDDEPAAGPLTIAVDVADTQDPTPPVPESAAA